MGGDADQGLRPQHLARHIDTAVILPEMDPVRPDFRGQGQVVVDDKSDTAPKAETLQLTSLGQTRGVILHLVPVLEAGHTTGKRRCHPFEQMVIMVGYEIEPFRHLQLLFLKQKSRDTWPRLPGIVSFGSLVPLSYAGANRIRFQGSPRRESQFYRTPPAGF